LANKKVLAILTDSRPWGVSFGGTADDSYT
jgi:hypothetical protein